MDYNYIYTKKSAIHFNQYFQQQRKDETEISDSQGNNFTTTLKILHLLDFWTRIFSLCLPFLYLPFPFLSHLPWLDFLQFPLLPFSLISKLSFENLAKVQVGERPNLHRTSWIFFLVDFFFGDHQCPQFKRSIWLIWNFKFIGKDCPSRNICL